MSSKTKTTVTKEEAKPALVPKLRFPEFRGAEGWECGQLEGALSSISNGLVLEQSSDTSGFKVTRIETISAGTIDLAKVGLVKTSQDISAYKLRVGDILLSNINSVAHIGKSVFVDRDYDLYHGMNLLRLGVNRTKHDPQFIYYLINTDGIRESLRERANKAVNQASINQTELGKTAVALPLKPEQQKLAECLSSVDALMAAQARKVDAIKTHKKGLMQQLFPREGETQPRLRFREFQNAGEWDSKPIGELGEVITGKTPSTKEAGLWGGDLHFITPTDISEDCKFQHNAARTVIETKGMKVLPVGSIVYTCIASIGKMALTVRPSITNQQINGVIPNKRAFGEFLYYALANLTPFIKTLPATNTLPIINKTDFSKIAVSHPANKAEQQRIAECLSSLDALLTAETQKHEALKTHKKGLMQQLFPSPEEATP
jgi:type I restriction enzyme S subunit